MIKSNIKYIITDLDGTVLENSHSGITKHTINIIKEFQIRSNNKLTIATGRHLSMIKEYIDILDINFPVITSNGALVIHPKTNEIISNIPIKENILNELLQKLHNEKFDLTIYTYDIIYGEENSARINSIKKYNESVKNKDYIIKYHTLNNVLDFLNINKDVLKIIITIKQNSDLSKIDKINKIISEYPEISLSSSRKDLYEINDVHATKGNAIKTICNKLSIDINDILVYGDSDNDIDMFECAGYSVAVGNAINELKKIANEIIDNLDKNGVAKHINNNFLK